MTSSRALAAALIAVIMAAPAVPATARTCTITIINREGRRVPLRVELAASEMDRQRGLMYRKSLEKNSGMLFVFTRDQYLNFWMKNTYVPLSIAYIGANGTIRDIQDMEPLDTSITYPSRYPARYALEVNRGWFAANGIVPGCRIELNGCVGKQDPVIGR